MVATAVRLNAAENSVNIFIASNSTLPYSTIDYITMIWDLLRQISATSPHSKDDQMIKLVKQLEVEVIKFTFLKIQRRVTSKLDRFWSIPVEDLDNQHPVHYLRRCLCDLDQHCMRIDGVLREKPASRDDQSWHMLRIFLKETSRAIKSFLNSEEDARLSLELSRTSSFRGYKSYLKEIMSTIADTELLTRAAISPLCRPIFQANSTVSGLSDYQIRLDRLPQSSEEWQQAMERPVGYFNHSHTSSQLVMGMSCTCTL